MKLSSEKNVSETSVCYITHILAMWYASITYSTSQQLKMVAENKQALANMEGAMEKQIMTQQENFDILPENFKTLD